MSIHQSNGPEALGSPNTTPEHADIQSAALSRVTGLDLRLRSNADARDRARQSLISESDSKEAQTASKLGDIITFELPRAELRGVHLQLLNQVKGISVNATKERFADYKLKITMIPNDGRTPASIGIALYARNKMLMGTSLMGADIGKAATSEALDECAKQILEAGMTADTMGFTEQDLLTVKADTLKALGLDRVAGGRLKTVLVQSNFTEVGYQVYGLDSASGKYSIDLGMMRVNQRKQRSSFDSNPTAIERFVASK